MDLSRLFGVELSIPTTKGLHFLVLLGQGCGCNLDLPVPNVSISPNLEIIWILIYNPYRVEYGQLLVG